MGLKNWLTLLLVCSTFQTLKGQDLEDTSSNYIEENLGKLFETYLDAMPSAWKGHRNFAEWLVKYTQPDQVVDLGVDYGYSTFIFANAVQKNGKGIVTGIDLFQGEGMTGIRNTYDQVMAIVDAIKFINLEIIKGDFNTVSQTWNRTIDILHIDGYHSYQAVSNDFNTWSPFVPDQGIVLFHDINVPNPDFGVINLFRELEGGHKLYFLHSYGLGIFTKNTALYEEIKRNFTDVHDYSTNPL